MTSFEFQKTFQHKDTLKNEVMDELSAHKYNLFQQFFVIGFDSKVMYNINKIDIKQLPNELLIPKVISKYPNKEFPYINIPDSIVASHCFPKGLLTKILYYENNDLKYMFFLPH